MKPSIALFPHAAVAADQIVAIYVHSDTIKGKPHYSVVAVLKGFPQTFYLTPMTESETEATASRDHCIRLWGVAASTTS